MQKIKRWFGDMPMTWPSVFVLAVVTAVYTALINQVPFLYDTSFRDIAIYPEYWILFAVIIVVNCEKWWEASIKCFVFFLVSQPLIYLIEVPFSEEGWGLFAYYPYWFYITLLTIPGGAIAFLLKRKDWISVLVLSVATGYLAYAALYHLDTTLSHFPYHLFSAVFCVGLALFLIFVLLDKNWLRTAAFAVLCAALVYFAVSTQIWVRHTTEQIGLGDGEWVCVVDDASIATVRMENGIVTVTSGESGSTVARFTKEDGTIKEYDITVLGKSMFCSEIEPSENSSAAEGTTDEEVTP